MVGLMCHQGDLVAVAHDRLCKSCLNYLIFEEIQSIQRLDELVDYPFLEYALGNWFLHAQEAEDGGIDQSSIIGRFRWPRPRYFEKWYGLFEEVCVCDEYVSLSSGLGFLHISTMSNLVSVVQYLLRHGDNINAKDDDGNTPLHYAASLGQQEILSTLLNEGMDVDAKNESESTPLKEAVWIGNYHAVQLLLSVNASMDLVNPLIKAAYSGDLRIIELLLDHGADYNSQGRRFRSALEAALTGGKMEVISLFVERGAEIDIWDCIAGTPLQVAISQGDQVLVEHLVTQSEDISTILGYPRRRTEALESIHDEIAKKLRHNNLEQDQQKGKGKKVKRRIRETMKAEMRHIRTVIEMMELIEEIGLSKGVLYCEITECPELVMAE